MTSNGTPKPDSRVRAATRPKWERKVRKATKAAEERDEQPLQDLKSGDVTQIGSRGRYRAHPRFDSSETDVSVLRGVVQLEKALRSAYGRPPRKDDSVRMMRVADLADSGYRACDTRHRNSPLHASIYGPSRQDSPDLRQWWLSDERVTLDNVAAMYSEKVEVNRDVLPE